MGGKRTPGLRRRGKQGIWSIQKTVRVGGKSIRLCETTGTSSLEEAERYLAKRIEQVRSTHVYGEVSPLTLAEASEKYLLECTDKSYWRAETALAHLCRFLGPLRISEVHDGTVQPYVHERLKTVSAGTVNRELGVLVRILNLCARNWRNEAGQPYLGTAPAITRAKGPKRAAFPISKDEELRLLENCPEHVRQLALFALNTGARAGEITALRWDWLVTVPELGVNVFVLPSTVTKNGEERVIPLNAIARRIVDERRGSDPEFVFTWKGKPLARLSNSAWRKAKREAKLPIRFHDLRHTFGHRLRAAGVSLEDRKALLGHSNGEITTHYSAADLESMIENVESIVGTAPSTVLRTGWRKSRQKRGKLPHEDAVLH